MKDFCGHLRYNAKKFSLGASAYLAEFNTKRIALGLDYQVNFKKITISGETVYQRNSNPSEIFSGIDDLKEFKSLSSYLQFDLELSHKFHLYGLYEIWDFRVDNVLVAPNPKPNYFMESNIFLTTIYIGWSSNMDICFIKDMTKALHTSQRRLI